VPHPPIDSLRFAEPLEVSSPDEAFWYHSFTWPDGTETLGRWDFRGLENAYLGRQDFAGKSVLEIGPANGYLTKEMEARGAAVTCIDVSDDEPWQAVPRKDIDLVPIRERHAQDIQAIKRGWWYAQRQFGGDARVAYVGASALPALSGEVEFDIALIACVLEHVRHPIDLLYDVASLARTIIVTEPLFRRLEWSGLAAWRPAPGNEIWGSWWHLSSGTVAQVLGTALFARTDHYTRAYPYPHGPESGNPGERELFTSVFRRS
jgi:SAM-dependent methyltransferase